METERRYVQERNERLLRLKEEKEQMERDLHEVTKEREIGFREVERLGYEVADYQKKLSEETSR